MKSDKNRFEITGKVTEVVKVMGPKRSWHMALVKTPDNLEVRVPVKKTLAIGKRVCATGRLYTSQQGHLRLLVDRFEVVDEEHNEGRTSPC